jgi:hypothetical protein
MWPVNAHFGNYCDRNDDFRLRPHILLSRSITESARFEAAHHGWSEVVDSWIARSPGGKVDTGPALRNGRSEVGRHIAGDVAALNEIAVVRTARFHYSQRLYAVLLLVFAPDTVQVRQRLIVAVAAAGRFTQNGRSYCRVPPFQARLSL